MKKVIDIISLTLIMSLIISMGYMGLEPEVVAAADVNDSVVVTLNVTAGISITSPADTPMSTTLGVGTNSAIATTTWNVKTNASGGYELAVKANTDPAMKHDAAIYVDDYTPGTPDIPETWSVSNTAEFGYSAYGTDTAVGSSGVDWGTGSNCGATSTPSATLKYRDFTTVDFVIAARTATTTTSGIDTTICYAVEQNNFYVPAEIYTATITATATTL